MLIPRGEFLWITGMNVERFKSLHRRQQVPRWIKKLENEGDDTIGYFPFEAVLLRAAERITEHTSLDWSEAQSVVENSPSEFMTLVFCHNKGKDCWIGVERIASGIMLHCGEKDDIVSSFMSSPATERAPDESLTLIPVSSDIAELVERARYHGIELLKNV